MVQGRYFIRHKDTGVSIKLHTAANVSSGQHSYVSSYQSIIHCMREKKCNVLHSLTCSAVLCMMRMSCLATLEISLYLEGLRGSSIQQAAGHTKKTPYILECIEDQWLYLAIACCAVPCCAYRSQDQFRRAALKATHKMQATSEAIGGKVKGMVVRTSDRPEAIGVDEAQHVLPFQHAQQTQHKSEVSLER